jgi:hypothetical protein
MAVQIFARRTDNFRELSCSRARPEIKTAACSRLSLEAFLMAARMDAVVSGAVAEAEADMSKNKQINWEVSKIE